MIDRNEKNFVTATTEVQAQLKRLILTDILSGVERKATFKKCQTLIVNYSQRIKDEKLRIEFENALAKGTVRLYSDVYSKVVEISGAVLLPVTMLKYTFSEPTAKQLAVAIERGGNEVETFFQSLKYETGQEGYTEDVKEHIFAGRIGVPKVRTKVKAELSRLIRAVANAEYQDEDGNILRARAEMHVRHEAQMTSLEGMKNAGVKLVWASVHNDCSPRCLPWQGKLYSLDGTSGEIDGNKYQPLEVATNILTPNGKWYNGLLGFNCRHRLIPYHERHDPPVAVSRAEAKKRYAIDQQQRRMEVAIRNTKMKAVLYGTVSKDLERDYYDRAKTMTKEYRDFCEKNGVVAMTYRTQVMDEEKTAIS